MIELRQAGRRLQETAWPGPDGSMGDTYRLQRGGPEDSTEGEPGLAHGADSSLSAGGASSESNASLMKLRQVIADHEKADRQRGLISRGAAALYTADDRSLADLKDMAADLELAMKEGDRQKLKTLHTAIDEKIEGDRKAVERQNDISHYASAFLKTATLFMRGRAGLFGVAAAYGLEQINPADPAGTQLIDGGLGVAKGLSLRAIFGRLGEAKVGIAAKGVGLGVSSRFAEMALTRQTYIGPSGQTDPFAACERIFRGTVTKELLAVDVAVFGLAHGLIRGGNSVSLGRLEKSPLASTMLTAASFGLSAGTAAEVTSQVAQGKGFSTFDYGRIFQKGLIQAGLDTLAGAPGGLQARAYREGKGQPAKDYLAGRLEKDVLSIESIIGQRAAFSRLGPQALRPGETASGEAATAGSHEYIWFPERNLASLSAEKQSGLVREVRSPLIKEPLMRDFSERLLALTERWGDGLSQEVAVVSFWRPSYEFTLRRAQETLVDTGLIKESELHRADAVRQALKDHPAELEIYNDYIQTRDKHAQAVKQLNEGLRPRLAELEDTVNGFLRERGLPPVKLRMAHDMGVAGAQYESGVVTLRNTQLLGKTELAELVENSYHELTHLEQETLMLRHIADHLAVGSAFNSADINAVRSTYGQLGEPVTYEHVAGVLALRAGTRLSTGDAERARSLMLAVLRNAPPGPEFMTSADDFRITQRELAQIDRTDGAVKLAERLAGGPGASVLSQRLFGAPAPPAPVADLIADRHKVGPEFNGLFRAVLGEALKSRLMSINSMRQAMYERYMAGLHEKEAWVVGQTARQMVQERLQSARSAGEPAIDFGL